jgi:hypothetical protein
MAVQICTVRYIGTFLGDDPLAVPWEVVDYLAGQLGIDYSSCVKQYADRTLAPALVALLEVPEGKRVSELERLRRPRRRSRRARRWPAPWSGCRRSPCSGWSG